MRQIDLLLGCFGLISDIHQQTIPDAVIQYIISTINQDNLYMS